MPKITKSSNNQQLSIVRRNQQVKLKCEVTGDDITGGYWERVKSYSLPNSSNISSLSNDKKTLTITINKARPTYSGGYRCVVYSRWGVAQSRDVQVNITSKINNVLL